MLDSKGENQVNSKFDIDEHFLRLYYSDGFGWRLLGIKLLVNLDFNYYLSFETYEISETTKHGTLPLAIIEKLKMLLECNLTSLDEDYFIHPGASNSSSYYLTINQFGTTANVAVGLSFETHKVFSTLENEIFVTLDLIDHWLTEMTGFKINSDE